MPAFYYRLFYFHEENELLNPLNEEDLFALHYVLLPRVNRSLQVFQSSWNDHGLRTEGLKQLFTAGLLRLRHSGMIATAFFDSVSDDYCTVEEGASVAEVSGVPLPRIYVTPNDHQMSQLRASVDPLSVSDDYGVSLYCRCLEIVESLSRIMCN